jgi:hypothetical protein
MEPTEDQIKELMTTVACAVCGANYQSRGVEVLGHRDGLWFLKVSCETCATCGLAAATVKVPDESPEEDSEQQAVDPRLDQARAPGPIKRGEAVRMRTFLDTFDGDFKALFSSESDQPAA